MASPAKTGIMPDMPSTNHLLQLVHQRAARLRSRVETLVWSKEVPLAVLAGESADFRSVSPPPSGLTLLPVTAGSHAGPPGWRNRWCRVDIPAGPAGRHMWWRCQGETTAWLEGEPWAGLDIAHPSCPLPERACTLWLDHHLWATAIWAPGFEPITSRGARFDSCGIRSRDEDAAQLHARLDTILQIVHQQFADHGLRMPATLGHCDTLNRVSPLLRRLLGGLDAVCDAFDRGGVQPALLRLRALSDSLPSEAWWPRIAAVGQSHIDLVYLWPERVGEAKGVHTCSTTLRLMEADPAFRFSHSQPSQYRALQRLAPALFERIKARIREGRWEVTGALECEADTHLPCGEALFRSFALGQAFTRELTGAPAAVCWLPDVFGYSACLPQLLQLAGVEGFFTAKLSWSAITSFPWTAFRWRSPDGSAVLAQVCPINYNSNASVEQVVQAGREYREAHVHPEMIVSVGYGDGGGGSDDATLRRVQALGDHAGAPPVAWSRADEAFRRLATVADQLPEWQGELYLEGHRGTLTSQRRYKSAYRALERALQTREAAHVAAGLGPIPDEPWLRLCLAQFHDALPGSSIADTYAEMTPELERLAREALSAAAGVLSGNDGACVFNPLPIAISTVIDTEQGPMPVRLGALECAPLAPATGGCVRADATTLDNGLVHARFDADGRLIALREDGVDVGLAAPPYLSIAPDVPANYDAWDLDRHVLRLAQNLPAVPLSLSESGPHRAALSATIRISDRSALTLRWSLAAGERHLRLELDVDWQEDHHCLRLHLPTTMSGRNARYGCAFGAVSRPQVPGGPADEAQWEVPGSRWAAAVRDDGTGLALVSEATWGFGCRDGELSATLLRAPGYPDRTCDRGSHRIRLAIGAHRDVFADGRMPTAAAADALFTAPLTLPQGRKSAAALTCTALGSLVPAWVRPVGGGFELRAHEVAGGRGTMRMAGPARGAPIDALERLGTALAVEDGRLSVPYAPYQIVSLRLG
jgi:alpha-mannosidase